jgi:hypothetical protein
MSVAHFSFGLPATKSRANTFGAIASPCQSIWGCRQYSDSLGRPIGRRRLGYGNFRRSFDHCGALRDRGPRQSALESRRRRFQRVYHATLPQLQSARRLVLDVISDHHGELRAGRQCVAGTRWGRRREDYSNRKAPAQPERFGVLQRRETQVRRRLVDAFPGADALPEVVSARPPPPGIH